MWFGLGQIKNLDFPSIIGIDVINGFDLGESNWLIRKNKTFMIYYKFDWISKPNINIYVSPVLL